MTDFAVFIDIFMTIALRAILAYFDNYLVITVE
jgi:hypothetical protein